MKQFRTMRDSNMLARAIVETMPQPFVVLDEDLCVVAANSSFYETFDINSAHPYPKSLLDLGNGDWNRPAIRQALAAAVSQRIMMEGVEFEQDLGRFGKRIFSITSRLLNIRSANKPNTLLAFADVTEIRQIAVDKQQLLEKAEKLLAHQRVLLQEMQHRIGNSLQIIASILMLKARAVSSDETRRVLEDARQRVVSVATVQNYLHLDAGMDEIDVSSYLTKLCKGLASSIVLDSAPVTLEVSASETRISSQEAVSLGLIVTELVINAIKYAFPVPKPDAKVIINYRAHLTEWHLTVSDNGVGQIAKPPGDISGAGLGSLIIDALAKRLDASVSTISSAAGMSVSITQAGSTSPLVNGAGLHDM